MNGINEISSLLQGVFYAILIAITLLWLTPLTLGAMSVATVASIIYGIAVAVVR